MARESCAHCRKSFEESELTVLGGQLVCPRCQGRPADSGEPPIARIVTPEDPPRDPPHEPEATAPRPREVKPRAVMIAASSEDAAPRGFWRGLYCAARDWSTGRCWWIRLPLLVLMAYVMVRHLTAPYYPVYYSIFSPLNLAIHEAGHLLFRPHVFGNFIQMAAGTAMQCAVPLLCIAMFFKQRDFFAMAFCLGWFGINVFEAAIYAADSQARNLMLVSPVTSTPIHDWVFMLNYLGIHVKHARDIAHGLRALGTLSMLAFLVPGSLMVWRMWTTRGQPSER